MVLPPVALVPFHFSEISSAFARAKAFKPFEVAEVAIERAVGIKVRRRLIVCIKKCVEGLASIRLKVAQKNGCSILSSNQTLSSFVVVSGQSFFF